MPLLAVAASASHAEQDRCARDGRYVMGTVLQLEVCGGSEGRRRAALASGLALGEELEATLSTWRLESATSRLNRRAGRGLEPLPPPLVEVLALSREYATLSGGTFDVTVGPLVALWRSAAADGVPPESAALASARARVGSERIVLAADGGSAALERAGMAVDFGGIGKGFALDRIAGRMRASGFERALLDFGRSSVVALGSPPDAPGWRLLLAHPSGARLGVVELRDRALSVSGSLAQGGEIGGRRYGHVIDPRTGRPLERDLLAAVVAPTAAAAEALSKALLVLGERDGIALLERLDGVEGLLAEADGRAWETPGWRAAVTAATRR